jgi:CheY-like chemotaxis protein
MRQILLVEDNPNDIELTIEALKSSKIMNPIDVAEDGEIALNYLLKKGKYTKRESGNPIVILLDIKMPKLNGLEVLKEIKKHPQLKLIPVVMLTSSKEDNDLIESYKLGVNAYVVKPVEFDHFVGAVKNLGVFWLLVNECPESDIE